MDTSAPVRSLTVTVEQAAGLLGVSRTSAYELVHTGEIHALRFGRRILIPVAWLAEQVGLEPSDILEILTLKRTSAVAARSATRRRSQ